MNLTIYLNHTAFIKLYKPDLIIQKQIKKKSNFEIFFIKLEKKTKNYFYRPDLMVKKLRYYARFIVVCLLLKKNKQVSDLIRELSKQIDEYVKIYDPEDQLEWQLVKNEINDFIIADNIVNLDQEITVKSALSNRLNSLQVPVFGPNESKNNQSNSLSLQEILIVGNCQNQVNI